MAAITTIGLDIAKSVFQVHGVDANGHLVIRRQAIRDHLAEFGIVAPVGHCRALRFGRTSEFTDARRPIFGDNAEIDSLSWAVGRFVDDARASLR